MAAYSDSKTFVLGSGKFYMRKWQGATDSLNLADLCVDTNQVSLVKGGATLSYKPETTEIYDDLKVLVRKYITSESVTFKTGLMTWDLDALHSIVGNTTYTAASQNNATGKLTLGNSGSVEQDMFAIAFVHKRADGSTLRIGMVCVNDAGLELAFSTDEATVIDVEFSAVSANTNDGRLCLIEEVPA